jgi:hypothetical protein
MNNCEIRIVTPRGRDRTALVQTIERLGHHVVDSSQMRDGTVVDAITVVDGRGSLADDWAQIQDELRDEPGPVVLITNRPAADMAALSHRQERVIVFAGGDSEMGYDIAFKLCSMLQTPARQVA